MRPAGSPPVVIVESPARALAIRRVLGDEVRVIATAGHVAAGAGLRRGAGRVLQAIHAAARDGGRILVATDGDREGEAIAVSLLRELGPAFPGRVARIRLAGADGPALRAALAAPVAVTPGRARAAALRREVDRAAAALVARVLGPDGPAGLGRVGVAALRRIVDREEEVRGAAAPGARLVMDIVVDPRVAGSTRARRAEAGKADVGMTDVGMTDVGMTDVGMTEAVTPSAGTADAGAGTADARMAEAGATDAGTANTGTAEAGTAPRPGPGRRAAAGGGRGRLTLVAGPVEVAEAARLAAALEGRVLPPGALRVRREVRPPPPPLDTAGLLAAADGMGLGPERVLAAARRLYEGVEVDGEVVPLVSYPRTAEAALDPDFAREGRRRLGLPPRPRDGGTPPGPLVHGALRPTSLDRPPEAVDAFLAPPERRVYRRIWEATRAALGDAREVEILELAIEVGGRGLVARGERDVAPASGATRGEEPDGAAARAGDTADRAGADRAAESRASTLRIRRVRTVAAEGPAPFRPGELIADLARHGIGRPSTWADVARRLREAGLARGEGGRVVATEAGRAVDRTLRAAAGPLLAPAGAAALEAGLRAVEDGAIDPATFRRRFVEPLARASPAPPRRACARCGRPLLAGPGGGEVCAGFPACAPRGARRGVPVNG